MIAFILSSFLVLASASRWDEFMDFMKNHDKSYDSQD